MKKFLLALGVLLSSITLAAGNTLEDECEVWWGYYTGGERGALGVSKAETYYQGAYYGGDLSGKVLKGVRFYLRDITNLTTFKLWISSKLPANADKADLLCVSLDKNTLEGGDPTGNYGMPNEYMLEEPFMIPAGGVYVGLSYKVTNASGNASQYPIVTSSYDNTEKSLYLKTSASVTSWGDYAPSYGSLAQELLLAGNFYANALKPNDFGNTAALIDSLCTVKVTVTSCGTQEIESFDYVISTEGVPGEEQHYDMSDVDLNYCGSAVVRIPFNADAELGTAKKTLTITKVNGVDNETDDNTAMGSITTVNKIFTHRIAVEEFTGTGCGYCPRGWVGMEKLRENFGDNFIGLALHQYNGSSSSDAMELAKANYASLSFSGAPSCRINRGDEIDPYYGSKNDILVDFQEALDELAAVGVSVSGKFNEDSTTVEAAATVEALFDGNSYTIEYVIMADSLSGTSNAWKQSNYYYQYSKSDLPEDMHRFCSGGEYGKSKVFLNFNDVVIGSSYKNKKNTATEIGALTPGTPVENAGNAYMPTNANLLNAINYDNIYIVALVIDKKTKKIANCAKAKIEGYESGEEPEDPSAIAIAPVATQNDVIYNIAGQKVNGNYRGLVIKNGTKQMK